MSKKTHKADLILIQKKLVDIRKEIGITQSQLAKKVDRTQQYICKFEKCDGRTIDALWDIANVLGYKIVLCKKE